MKALQMNQQQIVETVRTIYKTHPTWQIIVVQTTLHEAYSDMQHIEPYCYEEFSFSLKIPQALAQALSHQRDWFKDIPVHFVPIDFTLPEDGFSPVHYGLESLWDTIEKLMPKV
jgi:hypothetical protein